MKVDLKRELDGYQARVGEFRFVEMPPLRYLMVDGRGDPNTSPEYANALAALYPVAYALKFASKDRLGRDYVVPPLEALWWADDMTAFTSARDASRWSWTAMILTPDWIDAATVGEVIASVAEKKRPPRDRPGSSRDPARGPLRADAARRSVRRRGPGARTPARPRHPRRPTADDGTSPRDLSGDPRRVAPERLRTILRQPVEDAT